MQEHIYRTLEEAKEALERGETILIPASVLNIDPKLIQLVIDIQQKERQEEWKRQQQCADQRENNADDRDLHRQKARRGIRQVRTYSGDGIHLRPRGHCVQSQSLRQSAHQQRRTPGIAGVDRGAQDGQQPRRLLQGVGMKTIDANPPEGKTEPMKTIHVWMVPESEREPEEQGRSWLPDWRAIGQRCVQFLALLLLAVVCTAESSPASRIRTLTVPAILLPVQTIAARAAIIPTGVKTIPARQARGILTVYNGSILRESLPAGFIVTASTGVEIATDQAVVVPPANLPEPGVAHVPAHAIQPGAQGNIAAYSISQNDGSSLVIKNLTAFTGGKDASTVQYVTSQDKDNALAQARQQVEEQQLAGTHPGVLVGCKETATVETSSVIVSWACQYATWAAPVGAQVLSASVQGRVIVLRVREVVLPQ
jgi:hypothetical protein